MADKTVLDLELADKDGDLIQADGVVRMCEDLDVEPSDVVTVRHGWIWADPVGRSTCRSRYPCT